MTGHGRSASDGVLAVYALTPQGAALGRRLADALDGDLYAPARMAEEHGARPFEALAPLAARTFSAYRSHLFVAAAGAVLRVIAPHLESKTSDPAVVVMDQAGRFAVSLLSGHLGGANELARRAAAVTGGLPVITTATDTAGLPALDLLAAQRGLAAADLGPAKAVAAALLAGDPVQILDPRDRLGLRASPHAPLFRFPADAAAWEPGVAGVAVTWRTAPPADADPGRTLLLHPPCLALGVGCRRGVSGPTLTEFVQDALARAGLALPSLAWMGSVEAKRDEPGLQETAALLGVELRFFPAAELARVPVPNPSRQVAARMGTGSVCEAAALLLAGGGGLVLEKVSSAVATVAVALREEAC